MTGYYLRPKKILIRNCIIIIIGNLRMEEKLILSIRSEKNKN